MNTTNSHIKHPEDMLQRAARRWEIRKAECAVLEAAGKWEDEATVYKGWSDFNDTEKALIDAISALREARAK